MQSPVPVRPRAEASASRGVTAATRALALPDTRTRRRGHRRRLYLRQDLFLHLRLVFRRLHELRDLLLHQRYLRFCHGSGRRAPTANDTSTAGGFSGSFTSSVPQPSQYLSCCYHE